MKTVNVAELEVPQVTPGPTVQELGGGVFTVTGTLLTVAISAAEIDAVIPVVPTNVVVRALPFHCTTEHGSKLFPITDRTNAPPPAAALEGISELIDGVGNDEGAVIVKLRELELAAPLDTKTVTIPREAVSAYVIAASSCVALTKAVGRGEPFQFTTESLVKVVPDAAVTVRVKPVGLQYGVEDVCVMGAESDAIDSG
jgi:hypothetical protein